MLSSMDCRCTELQTFMLRLHLNENMMTTEIVSRMSSFQGPEQIFPLVFSLKEEGNNLVKLRKFEEAFTTYTKAVAFLVLGLPCCAQGCHPFRDLAIPLNLNLAMCALKLSKFYWARCLCDCVLEFDPKNVKALFRRASACLRLGQLKAAENDLMIAKKVEPHNGDVLRELNKVTLLLRESTGATVKASKYVDMDVDSKLDNPARCLGARNLGFNPLNFPTKVYSNLVDEVESESVGSNSNGVCFNDLVGSVDNLSNASVDPPRISSELEDTNSISGSSWPSFNSNLAEPKRFSNQSRPGSILSISSPDYKKLAAGQVLCYFSPRSTGYVSIRVKSSVNNLDSSSEMQEDNRCSDILSDKIDNVADNLTDTPGQSVNACDASIFSHNSTHLINQNSLSISIAPNNVPIDFCEHYKNSSGGLRSLQLVRRHPFVPNFNFGEDKRRLKRSIKRITTIRVQPTPGMKRKGMSNTLISSYPVWKKRMLNKWDDRIPVMMDARLSSPNRPSKDNMTYWVGEDSNSSITTDLSAAVKNKKIVSLQTQGDFSIC